MVTPPGATSEEAAYRQDAEDNTMLDYGLVSESTNGLLLTNAHMIWKGHVYIPLNWDEGTDQLFAFLVIFSSIHGCGHHVTTELHDALKLFVKYWASFKKGFTALWGCCLGIVKLVHYFHMKMQ